MSPWSFEHKSAIQSFIIIIASVSSEFVSVQYSKGAWCLGRGFRSHKAGSALHSLAVTLASFCLYRDSVIGFWFLQTSHSSEFRWCWLRLPCQHINSGQSASPLLFCPRRSWQFEVSRQLPPVWLSGPLWSPSVVSKYLTANMTNDLPLN